MITGALSVSVGSVHNAKIRTTNERIKEVYKALGNYLIINKRLPCPASLRKIKTVDSDYGVEISGGGSGCADPNIFQSTTNANLFYGMVPVRALGLANEMAEDAFESKLVYIVDRRFTNLWETVPNFNNSTFSTSPYTAVMTINEKPSGITQAITADAIMVIISHGANKYGAFNANASTQNGASTDSDEQGNYVVNPGSPASQGTYDNIFTASSSNSDIFDDIVFFKRRNDMVEDFNAMFLIPCQDAGVLFGNVNAYYGQVVYATSSCSNPNEDKRLTKKCEAYGSWVDIVSSCP